jgi:hypothetical protein
MKIYVYETRFTKILMRMRYATRCQKVMQSKICGFYLYTGPCSLYAGSYGLYAGSCGMYVDPCGQYANSCDQYVGPCGL